MWCAPQTCRLVLCLLFLVVWYRGLFWGVRVCFNAEAQKLMNSDFDFSALHGTYEKAKKRCVFGHAVSVFVRADSVCEFVVNACRLTRMKR